MNETWTNPFAIWRPESEQSIATCPAATADSELAFPSFDLA